MGTLTREQEEGAAMRAILRGRPGLPDGECRDVAEAARMIEKYAGTTDTGGRFVEAHCIGDDADKLEAAAKRAPRSFDVWREQTTDGVKIRVKTWPEFAALCDDIRREVRTEQARRDTSPVRTLGIDIETYSGTPITDGVYRYAEDGDFEILLFAYSVNGGPVLVVDMASGEVLPERITAALEDPGVVKTAFYANFERVCIGKWLGRRLDPAQWDCTMARAAMLGLPLSLEAAGRVLGLERQKMAEGKNLIRYFSVPCKPTKANGGRTRNRPGDDPGKWETFKRYCVRDVEVEQDIRRRVELMPVPPSEHRIYTIDQRINDRGVLVDLAMVRAAIELDGTYRVRLVDEATGLSGLDNPNSLAQLKAWLEKETGEAVEKLGKKELPDMIKGAKDGNVRRMLELRGEMSKTSIKKYEAMKRTACRDGRVRGLLQYYGASRTGRWAGRFVQVQNLPQNHLPDLDDARGLLKRREFWRIEMMYDVPDMLSQLIRTAFIAKEGCTFIVCDFSAIEARVVSWLAGEEWRLEVFRTHGKIYEASASMMFKVPIDEITKTDPRRQKGKIAELALGYQGGTGALKQMGGERMGLSDGEMEAIVAHWREANPAIVKLWRDVEGAAKMAVRLGEHGEPVRLRGLEFRVRLGALTVKLPSGRMLCYPRPAIGENRFGKEAVTYEGTDQTTRRWRRMETYGGKLVENITQAIARDCLAVTMERLEERGYPIVFHVHDEVILEVPKDGTKTLDEVEEVFRTPIPWAEDLPLKGAGYETDYYLKD